MSNWMELGLTKDEEAFVRKGAELYKVAYLDTIDNIFVIARSIEILHGRYQGSGVTGAFADALVQWGFVARDGGPMNRAIISHLKQLLAHEAEVRAWWEKVPERTKRDWYSAKVIWRHWTNSKKPAEAPRQPSPMTTRVEPTKPTSAAPASKADPAAPVVAAPLDHAALRELAQARTRIAELESAQFSQSAVKRLEAWQRQRMKEMAQMYDNAVEAMRAELRDEHRKWQEDTFLPLIRKEQDDAKRVMLARRGVMNKETFNAIRRGLHPDSRNSISDRKLGEAFDKFMALEKQLLEEKDSPTTFHNLPRTTEEWDKMRREATAARRAKRAANAAARR